MESKHENLYVSEQDLIKSGLTFTKEAFYEEEFDGDCECDEDGEGVECESCSGESSVFSHFDIIHNGKIIGTQEKCNGEIAIYTDSKVVLDLLRQYNKG